MLKIFLTFFSVMPTVLGTPGPTYLLSNRCEMKASARSVMDTLGEAMLK